MNFEKESNQILDIFKPKVFSNSKPDKLSDKDIVNPKYFLTQEKSWKIYISSINKQAQE